MNCNLLICIYAVLATSAVSAAQPDAGKWPGPQGGSYASIAQLPDWSGTWAKPDGMRGKGGQPRPETAPPFRPEYAAEMKAKGERGNAEMCLPGGMPGIMGVPLGFEFLFTPGRVTILVEEGPTIRRVYTDGRVHSMDPDLTYAGESIGHWEGETLVIDTKAIRPKAQFYMGTKTSGETHVIERVSLQDHDHMRVDTVVEDPVALLRPWQYTWNYTRSKVDFVESYNCDSDRDAGGEPDLKPPPPQ